MPGISDIPVEVLLDNVLPSMPASDVLKLGSTNRFFSDLTSDDTFWKLRLQEDFNFSGEHTARTSGWKFIYEGLSRPRTCVWGENSQGRLGLDKPPKSSLRGEGVPWPVEISIPGKRIVNLTAGGMSFHALDSQGDVYVWGTLDGTSRALTSDGFSEPSKTADTPHKLALPAAMRSVVCGRLHTVMLSSSLDIYTFLCWGRPYKLVTDLLSNIPNSPDAPIQIECGWMFSAVLTHEGGVVVWWPGAGEFDRVYEEESAGMDNRARSDASLKCQAKNGVIPCHVWELQLNPFRLPDIPIDLPQLSVEHTGESEEKRIQDSQTRLIKIAALDNLLIGLTNRGHVLRYDHLTNDREYEEGRWIYLPEFSEVSRVRELPAFTEPKNESERIAAPATMHITHISAHFETFFAYSTGGSSIVLRGNHEGISSVDKPHIIPALQNRSVISVVLGDWHMGALTASGKLLTWGSFSKGALGLGDPADLEVGAPGGFKSDRQRESARAGGPFAIPATVGVPTEVRFDWGKKPRESFCFSAAAGGWHMGALVIDLEREKPDEVEDAHVNMPGSFAPETTEPQTPRVRGGLHLPVMPPRGRGGPGLRGGMMPFWMGHAAGRDDGGQ